MRPRIPVVNPPPRRPKPATTSPRGRPNRPRGRRLGGRSHADPVLASPAMRIASVGTAFPPHYYEPGDSARRLDGKLWPTGTSTPNGSSGLAPERAGRRPPPERCRSRSTTARHLGQGERRLDPRRAGGRRGGGPRGARRRRPGPRTSTPLLRHRHRRRHALDRRAADQPPGPVAEHQARADLRPRLRRRRGRHRPRRRLRARLSRPGGGAAFGRALLADAPAGGSVDPQPDRLRPVRRRRRRGAWSAGTERGLPDRPGRGSSPRGRSSTPTPSA